jgi:anti-sigma regulatory factor (Ser/Thr protein kinase)
MAVHRRTKGRAVTTAAPPERSDTGLVHEAMPYRDEDELLEGTIPYVRAALAAGHPVLVELPGARGGLVRDALGADAARVQFGDMAEQGRNPARIIPAVLHTFAEARPDQRVVMVAEPMWASRSGPEYTACVEHEALINLAFVHRDLSILCPYNLTDLPEQALSDAERTHPALREANRSRISAGYTDPRAVVDAISALQPDTPAVAKRVDFSSAAEAREAATEWATSAGLPPDRLTDAVIAISEVCGNTVAHTGDGGTLLCWQDSGSLVYEIRDGGHIQDLLAGRLPPPEEQESGRGLLMVNLLCDLVQIKTGPSGTSIRLWMLLPGS